MNEVVLRSILDKLESSICIVDASSYRIIYANQRMINEFSLCGESTDEICWKSIYKGMNDNCSSCPIKNTAQAESSSWIYQNMLSNKIYECNLYVIDWIGGKKAVLHQYNDITDKRNLTDALNHTEKIANEASSIKDDFLSRVNHELRTPLNAIIGMASIASKSQDMTKIKHSIDVIQSSSRDLLHIVNDILDISTINNNMLRIENAQFDIKDMIIEISEAIIPSINKKMQYFNLSVEDDVPSKLIGDSLRVMQILLNILSNSVKFTDDYGDIFIRVSLKNRTDNMAILQFDIKDNGIGISKDQQKRLFNKFEQIHGKKNRAYDGNGLGLAICKSIIDLMNGEISVLSDTNCGSIFSVLIPFGVADDKWEDSETLRNDTSQLKVLFIDKHEQSQAYFSQIMKKLNIDLVCVSSIKDAFTLFSDNTQNDIFDIVYIDENLLLSKIKNNVTISSDMCYNLYHLNKQNKSSVFLLSTGSNQSELREKFSDFGIIRAIQKPYFASTIIEAINDYYEQSTLLKPTHFVNDTKIIQEKEMIMIEPKNELDIKKYVDIDEGLGRVRNNAKIYKTLLNSFMNKTNMEQLKSELAAGDKKAAEMTVHAIKGVVANLSLKAAYEISTLVEGQIKNDMDYSDSLEKLDDAVNKTIECIKIVLGDL